MGRGNEPLSTAALNSSHKGDCPRLGASFRGSVVISTVPEYVGFLVQIIGMDFFFPGLLFLHHRHHEVQEEEEKKSGAVRGQGKGGIKVNNQTNLQRKGRTIPLPPHTADPGLVTACAGAVSSTHTHTHTHEKKKEKKKTHWNLIASYIPI